jgi:hypothetical protein
LELSLTAARAKYRSIAARSSSWAGVFWSWLSLNCSTAQLISELRKKACACSKLVLLRARQWRMYLWSADVFPGIADATSLDATDLIDALVPSFLDKILHLQYTWKPSREFFVALSLGTLDVGEQHLNIPITAETTLIGCLANVKGRGMTVIRLLDCAV